MSLRGDRGTVRPVHAARGDGPFTVTVVGAGSPFTAALVDALAEGPFGEHEETVPRPRLRLLGRAPDAVRAVGHYAALRLAGEVSAGADPAALDGAGLVLVQIRPGGTVGRVADEQLAKALGAPADESLGVGGLAATLRGTPVLRGLAAEIAARCPDALVIVLTNPLSSSVQTLVECGLSAVGCCELPTTTAAAAAAVVGVRPGGLAWRYTGLSHRGFLHDLRLADDGSDVLPLLVERLRRAGGHIGGADAEEIEALGALPLKYHRLLSGRSLGAFGRGREVAVLRRKALDELRRAPSNRPPSLDLRPTPWYDVMVAPLVAALARGAPTHLVLDMSCSDGLVREIPTMVDADGVWPRQSVDHGVGLGRRAASWVHEFEAHESALLALLAEPRRARLRDVVALDPAIPASATASVVGLLEPAVQALARQPVAAQWSRT